MVMLAEKEDQRFVENIYIYIHDTFVSIYFLRNEIHEKLFTNDEKLERERESSCCIDAHARDFIKRSTSTSTSYNISALGLRWINIEFMREVQNVIGQETWAGYTAVYTKS